MESAPAPHTPIPDHPAGRLLRDRRLLGILIAGGVMAIVVTSVVRFSGAYFTSTSRSTDNEFSAATMGLTLARTGQIVNGAGMLPGDQRSGDQTITNTGHGGTLSLTAQGLAADSSLAQVLRVTVLQTSPAASDPAYDGPLTGLGTVALGSLAQGDKKSFTITVTWPASESSPSLSGTSASLDFRWTLASVS